MSDPVSSWFKKSHQDLKVAKFLLAQNDNDLLESCAFHCQQSIEKSMKGFLVHNKARTKKTHDLRQLAQQVSDIDNTIEFIEVKKSLIVRIKDFAVAYRYPDASLESSPLTQTEVISALDLAVECFDELSRRC